MNADRLFFIVGPLRTGSSLMARCIDDHPTALCLCESEINRVLFRDYFVQLHCQRMEGHGFSVMEVINYLDRKKQDDINSLMRWYKAVRPRLATLMKKDPVTILGDKSPDFYRSDEIVRHLAANYPLIYTVRDPRAIFQSIEAQSEATPRHKENRWESLSGNYATWKPHLESNNVLVIRYEDLVTNPEPTMKSVYSHLGLLYSTRFLEPFTRLHPRRFLWTTAIDWTTGVKKDFDPARIGNWKSHLTETQLQQIYSSPHIGEFMDRFGYER